MDRGAGGAVDIVSVAEPRSAYSNVCHKISLYECLERKIKFVKLRVSSEKREKPVKM